MRVPRVSVFAITAVLVGLLPILILLMFFCHCLMDKSRASANKPVNARQRPSGAIGMEKAFKDIPFHAL